MVSLSFFLSLLRNHIGGDTCSCGSRSWTGCIRWQRTKTLLRGYWMKWEINAVTIMRHRQHQKKTSRKPSSETCCCMPLWESWRLPHVCLWLRQKRSRNFGAIGECAAHLVSETVLLLLHHEYVRYLSIQACQQIMRWSSDFIFPFLDLTLLSVFSIHFLATFLLFASC